MLFLDQTNRNPLDGFRFEISYFFSGEQAILFLYSLGDEDLSINFGPQLGYTISMKGKIGSENVDLEGAKRFDVALGIGVTYHFRSMFAIARYNYGLTKVNEGGKAKNSVIQIGIGYKF